MPKRSFSPTQPLLESAYGIDAERLRAIFADLVLSFLKPSWEASGKARVAEKTPFNILVSRSYDACFPMRCSCMSSGTCATLSRHDSLGPMTAAIEQLRRSLGYRT